ncbi:transglycosylase SLT domain protein [Acetomicrobium hydrogeniformans ATCC BAA-1850]|uniref:Transglycosylase SLT domain protein n=2 Tax=Acetomicrobium hydrogeniformans TaxID=649746 RepID=A0A0T5XAB2_9BACT|nr:transglycosylase SLT domain protein [Acetomicrobium hydrogeniformans ATCC BAA-1850]
MQFFKEVVMILRHSLDISSRIIKIVTIFLFFSIFLSITTRSDSVVNNEPVKKTLNLQEQVIKALVATGNTPKDVLRWQEEHPNSSLRFLEEMPPEEQEKVGKLAIHIKKTNPKLSSKTVWREACAFVHYGKKYGISEDLLVAVANTESHFNPKAVSKKGAVGVMQVMWNIHAGLLSANGITSKNLLHDPELGIAAGALLLSRYTRAYGSEHKALDRYYGKASSKYKSVVNNHLRTLQEIL